MGLGNESDYTMFGRTLALPLGFSDNLRASIFMLERLKVQITRVRSHADILQLITLFVVFACSLCS